MNLYLVIIIIKLMNTVMPIFLTIKDFRFSEHKHLQHGHFFKRFLFGNAQQSRTPDFISKFLYGCMLTCYLCLLYWGIPYIHTLTLCIFLDFVL